MSYDRGHYYVTMGGNLPGGETWQTGARFHPDGAGDPFTGWSLISIDDIYTAAVTFVGTVGSHWPTDIDLRWAKLAAIDEDGGYNREPKLLQDPTPQVGSSTTRLPLQNAVVITLWSGQNFGPSNFGRMYLPALDWSRQEDSGQTSSTKADTVVAAAKTLLLAWEGEVSTVGMDYSLAIMGRQLSGSFKKVTELRVGAVADTQRRRRAKLAEGYQVETYP